MQKATRVINHNIAEPRWGLRRNVTPCFGARLVGGLISSCSKK